MSDNEEMMQTKNSSLEDSSGDESSSEAAATNEFSSRDGEPVNKPRKVGQLFLFFFQNSVKTGCGLFYESSVCHRVQTKTNRKKPVNFCIFNSTSNHGNQIIFP